MVFPLPHIPPSPSPIGSHLHPARTKPKKQVRAQIGKKSISRMYQTMSARQLEELVIIAADCSCDNAAAR
jgi:hypothetical protein